MDNLQTNSNVATTPRDDRTSDIVHRTSTAHGQTGPRLPSGKAESRRNTLKHGILSVHLFIERGQGAEEPRDFTELHAELRQIYRPEGRRQDLLVERIADAEWRLHRLRRFEIGAIHHRIDTDPDAAPPPDRSLDARIAECERRVPLLRDAVVALREDRETDSPDLKSFAKSAFEISIASGTCPTPPEIAGLLGAVSEKSTRPVQEQRESLVITYQGLVRREEALLADLRDQRDRAARDTERRGERERLLYAIPGSPDAYLLIRYETMLARIRDKAVKELDHLKTWGADDPQ